MADISLTSRSHEQMENSTSDVMSIVIENNNSTNKLNEISTVSIGVGPDETLPIEEYTYVGDIYDEKKHGKGILSYSDGRKYTGAFFADRRHGFGIFHTPNISEFKGLYCHDERFGPGILLYQKLQSADVGLWLSEDLIRLLYPHPKLILDIHITEKRTSNSFSSQTLSWYSSEELLRTVTDFHFLLHKKSPLRFFQQISTDKTFLSRYVNEHSEGMNEALLPKRKELDAYLSSIDENVLSTERITDISSPNETYEQQRLYNYLNKFWPLKQRASFPIDDIITNTRSSFPNPGPLENASLNLFELSYYGYEKEVRLTALHFATYQLHLNILNTLLDFGANVNQLSDENLTPLMISCLLYYGNDYLQTINLALEHKDPSIPNPRVLLSKDKNGLTIFKQEPIDIIIDEMKLPETLETMKIHDSERNNSYGFHLTDNLRECIRDAQYRERVYSVIVLLLRRGADPSYSDWPLPVLALAIRAGDKQIVELLLKKRANVNCRLDSIRHSSLTPLHIACGCLSSNVVDIAQLLLEYGADVNAESLANKKEYYSLIDPLILELIQTMEVPQNGRTPLHIACTRERSEETLNLVRLLLHYQANPNAICNGQTALSLAIAFGNESLVDLLLNHENTDPSTVLGFGNGNALCMLLSTFYESCWSYSKRIQLIERLILKNPKVLYPVRFGPKNHLGSCVDYGYYMFFADTRIAQSPYHSLTNQERVIINQRKELLAYIAKRFREEVTKYDGFLRLTPSDGSNSARLSSQEFRFCATCGRNIGVRLSVCKRCQKASFCSKTCIVNGWNNFHRYECRQLSPRPHTTGRNKNLTKSENVLLKDGSSLLKNTTRTNENNRLPPLSKILRQNRLKKRIKSASLEGIELSWNSTYNAPENYSFN
ncbi:hypothetical protein I4U23_027791 [Adineta vaga]|nr:hypothetical protein I4U23_027791 [Adineta vaga]